MSWPRDVMLRERHIFLVVTRFKQTCMATATRDYQRWIKLFLLTLNISFNICILFVLLGCYLVRAIGLFLFYIILYFITFPFKFVYRFNVL